VSTLPVAPSGIVPLYWTSTFTVVWPSLIRLTRKLASWPSLVSRRALRTFSWPMAVPTPSLGSYFFSVDCGARKVQAVVESNSDAAKTTVAAMRALT
jgi:hypothetical protein